MFATRYNNKLELYFSKMIILGKVGWFYLFGNILLKVMQTKFLTLKTPGEEVNLTVFAKEGVTPCFFVTFNIIIRHNIFPDNFIEIQCKNKKTK